MNRIAAVAPYVRLFTRSQYERSCEIPDWALSSFLAVSWSLPWYFPSTWFLTRAAIH